MTRRWPMKPCKDRLLMRASAIILCVRRGVRLTKAASTSSRTKWLTNVDVAQKLTAHWFFTHGNTSEVVLIDLCGFRLFIFSLTKVNDFLACWTGCDKFSFVGGYRHVVLSAAFPRNGSTIHHDDVAAVRVASISVASPICVDPSPQFDCVASAAGVGDWPFQSVTKILEDAFGA